MVDAMTRPEVSTTNWADTLPWTPALRSISGYTGAGFRGSGSAVTSTVVNTAPASGAGAAEVPVPCDAPISLGPATRLSHDTTGSRMVIGPDGTGGTFSGIVRLTNTRREGPPPCV